MLPFKKDYDEIEENLRSLGYKKFFNANYLYGFGLDYDKDGTGSREQFAKEVEDIVSVFDLMTDEHSEDVYLKIFKAHAEMKYNIPELSPNMKQYVDVNIPFRFNFHSFVDVGGYTGDTLKDIVKYYNLKQYIAFEPDIGNYSKLLLTAEQLGKNIGKAILLPIGLSDKNEYVRFFALSGGDSKIDELGEQIIQTVRLDDILKGYNGLMIKMDIEGAEISALNGARQIITETKPDLAICVYHRISDMWRIPLMLKKWVPEYSFYLRSHYSGTLETVLYATIV